MILATGDGGVRSRRGFTFIELLFVMIIASILLGVTAPGFGKFINRSEMLSTAGRLQNFMNYLHGRSIVEGKVISMTIDRHAGKYWAWIKDQGDVIRSQTWSSGVSVTEVTDPVRFYPDGTVDKIQLDFTDKDGEQVSLLAPGGYGRIKLQIKR